MAGWQISGDYFESCNCEVACPCVFLSDPSHGHCDVGVAWHIDRGAFDGMCLDDLNVAAVFQAPGNMMRPKSWKAAVYLDARANPAQGEALGKIFSGAAGGHFAAVAGLIGQIAGVKMVPITYRAEGRRRTMKAGDALEMAIEATPGADPGKDVLVANTPLCVAPGFASVVARSSKSTYRGDGWSWDNTGKNGFYSRFEYSG